MLEFMFCISHQGILNDMLLSTISRLEKWIRKRDPSIISSFSPGSVVLPHSSETPLPLPGTLVAQGNVQEGSHYKKCLGSYLCLHFLESLFRSPRDNRQSAWCSSFISSSSTSRKEWGLQWEMNCKTLLKEIKENLSSWKNNPCSWIARLTLLRCQY